MFAIRLKQCKAQSNLVKSLALFYCPVLLGKHRSTGLVIACCCEALTVCLKIALNVPGTQKT